jgi:Tfp pilus assembly protein PilF
VRRTPPRTAEAFAAALLGDGAGPTFSYEAAGAFVAAARSAGASASLVEVFELPGLPTPDPSGMRGAFAAVCSDGEGKGKIFEPLRGLELPPEKVAHRRLGGLRAVAPHYLLLANHHLLAERKPEEANRFADYALALDVDSPPATVMRAAIYLAGGGAEPALRELRRAVALRDDAVRRAGLAEALLMTGEAKAGEEELSQALKLDPALARTRALKAMLHLRDNELSEAKTEIEKAVAGGLEGPKAAIIWASYYHETGELDRAVAVLQAEMAKGGAADEVGIALVQTLLTLGRAEEAKAAAEKTIAGSADPEGLRKLFTAAAPGLLELAPTASMPASSAPSSLAESGPAFPRRPLDDSPPSLFGGSRKRSFLDPGGDLRLDPSPMGP